MISKRVFLTGLMAAGIAGPAMAETAPISLAANARPIDAAERLARINKLQGLMQAQGIAALLVESGSTLDYFTGVQWWTSERITAAVLPGERCGHYRHPGLRGTEHPRNHADRGRCPAVERT